MKILFLILLFFGNFHIFAHEKIIFFHIPKTAGVSVLSCLLDHYEDSEVCKYALSYTIENRSLEELRKFSLIQGHFFFSSMLQNLEEYKKITFLRDPVQRILSEYRYLKAIGCDKFIHPPHFSWGNPLYTMNNHQCLWLSSFDKNDPTISIEQHLNSAKYNLAEKFFFVGITERLDESLEFLYMLLHWNQVERIPHYNATTPGGEGYSDEFHRRSQSFPPACLPIVNTTETYQDELLEDIRQRNWADIELYNFACELYTNARKKWGFVEQAQDVSKSENPILN